MSTPYPDTGAERQYSLVDRLVAPLDQALRTLFGACVSARPYPAADLPETVHSREDRAHAAALMRVNHSGEIAAQALYQGQAFVADCSATKTALMAAAAEETDHLAWCCERINELGSRTSLLNPLWYAGSFAIGAVAGLAGDRTSFGFVAETERQVVEHLESHLQRLPEGDRRSRAILEQMSVDEQRHGHAAIAAGGAPLPTLARAVMKLTGRVMTRTAYWL